MITRLAPPACGNHCCQRQRVGAAPGRAGWRSHSRAALPPPQAAVTESLLSLVPWAVKNGVQFAKIKPSIHPGSGRGMVATADIAAGDCIINVPVSAAIRVYPGCPAVLQVPAALWQELPWYAQLALTLLHEVVQGPASKFADYCKQLPAAVDAPVLWQEEALQQLRCGYFIEQVQQQQQEWASLQQQLAPYVKSAGVTPEQLSWALSVVRSRTFAAPYSANPFGSQLRWLTKQAAEQQQQQHVMCPLLDLFNHSADVQSECEFCPDFRSASFRVVASQPWARGQQVFINYGSGSNDALLQLYGFVEPGNKDDRYIVRCLPAVLEQQGHTGNTPTDLAEVVFTRQGIAAVQLARALSDALPGTAPSGSSLVPYADLGSSTRAACAAAVQHEVVCLAVDASADQEVLSAFEKLPAKQAELEAKQVDLGKAHSRLAQLQQMLQQTEESGASAPSGLEADIQEQEGEAAAGSGQAELLSTLDLCQQLCDTLEAEVLDLQRLTAHWEGLVQENNQLAVLFRLEKHQLLAHILHELAAAGAPC